MAISSKHLEHFQSVIGPLRTSLERRSTADIILDSLEVSQSLCSPVSQDEMQQDTMQHRCIELRFCFLPFWIRKGRFASLAILVHQRTAGTFHEKTGNYIHGLSMRERFALPTLIHVVARRHHQHKTTGKSSSAAPSTPWHFNSSGPATLLLLRCLPLLSVLYKEPFSDILFLGSEKHDLNPSFLFSLQSDK